MKLIYLANNRLPTEKAHGLQIVKMCKAWSNLGEIILVKPKRKNEIKEDLFSFYKISNFSLVDIKIFDFIPLYKYWQSRIFSFLTFLEFALFSLIKSFSWRGEVFYTRDIFCAFFFSLFHKFVFLEMHDFPGTFHSVYRFTFKRLAGLVVTNNYKKEMVLKNFIFSKEKIIVAPNGVDLQEFFAVENSEAFRKKMATGSQKIILYSGHLYDWKGVKVLAQSFKYLIDDSLLLYFVGGTKEEIENFSSFLNQIGLGNDFRIKLVPYQKHELIPQYLVNADLLVLPNSGRSEESRYFTSPIKLFEYLASGRPILAASLPSLKELVNEENVFFFVPDDPENLAKMITFALTNLEIGRQMALKNRELVKSFCWDRRARIINSFIKSRICVE